MVLGWYKGRQRERGLKRRLNWHNKRHIHAFLCARWWHKGQNKMTINLIYILKRCEEAQSFHQVRISIHFSLAVLGAVLLSLFPCSTSLSVAPEAPGVLQSLPQQIPASTLQFWNTQQCLNCSFPDSDLTPRRQLEGTKFASWRRYIC